MAKIIDRDGVQTLITANVQLIDVLPPKEFSESHLPGAINIPLPQLSRATTGRLQSLQPTIAYCYDHQ
ncbi:MAG: rhodanese-like domain-containing protein [Candidatus Binatia bacterium]